MCCEGMTERIHLSTLFLSPQQESNPLLSGTNRVHRQQCFGGLVFTMRVSDHIRHAGKDQAIKKTIVNFFKANPNPDDNQVHQLAAKLKISPHDLETHIYALLSELLNRAGE